MPKGVYKRTSEMKTGKYKRTPEHNAATSEGLKNSDAVKANAEARRGVPLSPEHSYTIQKALTGVPHTPEHIAATIKGLENSEAVKAYADARRGVSRTPEACAAALKGREESGMYDKMRGGNDIVKHHFIYDHANPDQHTVEITRAEHTAHHHWMRRNGLKVPHLNVTEENKDIFER